MNIRVLREAGGIGDIVRTLPVVRGLREDYPDALIDVFAPDPYAQFVERAGYASRVIRTPLNRRPRLAPADEDKWGYLKTGLIYDRTIDLYCPAYHHEARHGREVWNDRIELFCQSAGLLPRHMTPHLPISPELVDSACDMLRAKGIPERKGWIALQPFSTDPARDWPSDHWRLLADHLSEAGYGVFALDSHNGRVQGFPCPVACSLPFLGLAAVLKAVRVLVGPDSGLAHLSGAVGGAAIGLTASQSGAVLYRHDPRHTYIQPSESALEGICKAWPCYWSRPRDCQRQVLKDAGRTCPALAALDVETVTSAVLSALLSPSHPSHPSHPSYPSVDGPGRMPPGAPPLRPGFDPRPVLDSIPPRAQVVDVGAALARAAHEIRRPITQDIRAAFTIPIPCRDRSQDHAALFAAPAQTWEPHRGIVGDWLWEVFRVLKVGGKLYMGGNPAGIPGFKRLSDGVHFSVWEKAHTWPKP